jgi:cyclopropane fatty-acyl-phospholipid synthase-like methyltransferase
MSEFERWQTRFSVPEYIFGTAPNAFLRSQAHLLPTRGTALAVADGEGRNGVWLAERGLDVSSFDFSPNAIAKAQALARSRGVTVTAECAEVSSFAWPSAAFDVIAAIFVQFVGPAERKRMFAGIRQALKSGGLLLMQGYRPEQLVYKTGGPSQVENLYTRALLETEFADMAELDISEHDSLVQEGSGHNGMAALIDLVARK